MVSFMGRKRNRKKHNEVIKKPINIGKSMKIPISDSETHSQKNQHQMLSLFPFPSLSWFDDYDVYTINFEGKGTIGYFGVFLKSGKFNYVVIGDDEEINETNVALFLKSFIKKLGLTPVLNPYMVKYL